MGAHDGRMSSWSDVRTAAPELAEKVQTRFDETGLGLLATLRKDGFPRISGLEQIFVDELWLGMMHQSLKAHDLQRDPRMALHSATEDKGVAKGDARVTGLAVEVTDDAVIAQAREDFAAHAGYPPPEGPMHLFRIDVRELSFLRPNGDHLLIETWREGGEARTIKRY
jgi:hypothetical protein